MFLLNGNPLPLDTPFTVGDTSYPANWLRLTSLEEKAAIGITEVPDTKVVYDDRFWWGHDNPKDLDQLKKQWTAQAKDTANKLLSQTDWMVIRKAERGVDVPADATAYRQAVIAECARLVTEIAAAADVPAFIAVVTKQNWPAAV
jgi:hypothetical protein